MTFRSWRSLLVALAVLALSGCGAMTAQNPSGKYTPVTAVADGDGDPVLVFLAIAEEAQIRVLDLQVTLRHACCSCRLVLLL